MPGYEDTVGAAVVFVDVLESPGHRCGGVFDVDRALDLGIQTIVDRDHSQPLILEFTGDELLTMSLMKRDTPVYYKGEPGIIHSVYFKPGMTVDQGESLVGICPPEKLPLIETIITRVKAEWTV